MQHLQRNWRTIALVGILVVSGGLWLGLGDRGTAVAQPDPPGYDTVTDAQRSAILAVMGDVGLDRDALVALNLTAQQAEGAVAALRTWWEFNAATLEAAKATIATKASQVRALRAAIRMGPAQPGQDAALATAIDELLAARAAYQTALNPLRTTVSAGLSASQRAAWASVEHGHSDRMPMRLLDLSAAQRLAAGKAWRVYRLSYAAAATSQERDAAVTAWKTALASITTQAQEDVLDAYAGYWVASSQAVAAALDTVLPPPVT